MKFLIRLFFVLCLLAGAARADTVIFKNGDKLSGTFVNSKDGNVAWKSEILGDLTIPLDKVQSVSVTSEAVVIGKDKKLTRGDLALAASGDWQLTLNGAPQTVSESNVTVILPVNTYNELMDVSPAPWRGWKGAINFGYSFQHGDQQTRSLTSSVAATRERSADLFFVPHWRTNYAFSGLFSKAQEAGTFISSNILDTSLREDYLFSRQNFAFVRGEAIHSDLLGLYLEQAYGGGLGRDIIHSTRTLFSVVGGVNYLHQRFTSGPSVSSVELLTGEKLGIDLTSRIRLDHHLDFYPDLHGNGRFRFDTATDLSLKINKHLAATAGVIDLYLHRPAPGSKQNNIAFTTGVGYSF